MEFDPQVQSRWKIALACGSISAGMLFSSFVVEHLGFLTYPISLLGSIVGILLGVLSVAAKEKKWGFAVIAILLSFVCPYHFVVTLFEAHIQV